MKKLVVSALSVAVLGLGFASIAGEKAAAKEKVRIVKVDEKKDLDVYLQWITLCSEFRDKKISKGVVKFKDFNVIVKCEFNK
jgi:hypothetical protein